MVTSLELANTFGYSFRFGPSRGTKAVRLTYDHKGSDQQEAQRITDAGGYVMNNRVNGLLPLVTFGYSFI